MGTICMILFVALLVSFFYNLFQRSDLNKMRDSRNEWYDMAKGFAVELSQKEDDILEENRF